MEPQQNQPVMTPQNGINQPTYPEHKKVGPIVATLIIVLVLIIAALYLFASRLNKQSATQDAAITATDQPSAPTDTSATPPSNVSPDVSPTATPSQTNVRPVTNSADDVQSLQNDLNSSTSGLNSQNLQ